MINKKRVHTDSLFLLETSSVQTNYSCDLPVAIGIFPDDQKLAWPGHMRFVLVVMKHV